MNSGDQSSKTATYSVFQKMVFFIIIPLLYSLVLLFVLMSVFDHGNNALVQQLISYGSRVPLLQKMIAKPEFKEASTASAQSSGNTKAQLNQQLQDSKNETNATQLQVNQLQATVKQKDDANQALQKEIQDLNDQLKTKQQTEAELNKKSNEIAQEYSTMQPNQAANIISNMSLQDADFTLSTMKPQQRAAILAKMASKKAADITSSLKDFTITQDNQIKNLQDKLQKLTDNKQTLDEIVKTYSQMPAPNAAKLISQIMKTDQKKAILLMSQMDTATRAQIISALSTDKTNPDGVNQAALLMKSLM